MAYLQSHVETVKAACWHDWLRSAERTALAGDGGGTFLAYLFL